MTRRLFPILAAFLLIAPLAVEAEPPDLAGAWDAERARRIAFDRLDAHGATAGAFGFDPDLVAADRAVTHEIHAELALSGTDQPSPRVLVTVTRPADEFPCRPCAPALGFVEFRPVDGGWALGAVTLGAFHDGSYGDPPAEIRAESIGLATPAVVTEHGYLAQGYSESWARVYASVGGEWRQVFDAPTAGDAHGVSEEAAREYDWSSTLEFVPAEGPASEETPRDLVIEKEGVGYEGSARVRYRFDGARYVEPDS